MGKDDIISLTPNPSPVGEGNFKGEGQERRPTPALP